MSETAQQTAASVSQLCSHRQERGPFSELLLGSLTLKMRAVDFSEPGPGLYPVLFCVYSLTIARLGI